MKLDTESISKKFSYTVCTEGNEVFHVFKNLDLRQSYMTDMESVIFMNCHLSESRFCSLRNVRFVYCNLGRTFWGEHMEKVVFLRCCINNSNMDDRLCDVVFDSCGMARTKMENCHLHNVVFQNNVMHSFSMPGTYMESGIIRENALGESRFPHVYMNNVKWENNDFGGDFFDFSRAFSGAIMENCFFTGQMDIANFLENHNTLKP